MTRWWFAAPVLLLAACSGGASHPGQPTTTRSPTRAAAPPTTQAPTVAPPATPTYRLLSAAQIQAALLQLSAMPSGWAQDPTPDTSTSYICGYHPAALPQVDIHNTFVQGAGFSAQFRRFEVRQFASPAAAMAAWQSFRKELSVCHSETVDGTTYTYSPANAPRVGDASGGIRIDGGGTGLRDDAVVGPVIVSVTFSGDVSLDVSPMDSLFVQQVQRYVAAAQ